MAEKKGPAVDKSKYLSTPKGGEEGKPARPKESLTFSLVENKMDEQGNFPNALDKIFADVNDPSEGEARDDFYDTTGVSRAPTYVDTAQKFEDYGAAIKELGAEAVDEAPGFIDGISEGFTRIGNRFIRKWNDETDFDLPEFDEAKGMEESGAASFVDDTVIPIIGEGLMFSFNPALMAVGGVLLAANAYSYLNDADRDKLNALDFPFTGLMPQTGEGIIPDSEDVLEKMGDAELFSRALVSQAASAALFASIGKGIGLTTKMIKGANESAKAITEVSKQMDGVAAHMKTVPLTPESLTSMATTLEGQVAIRSFASATSVRGITKNTKVLDVLHQGRVTHGATGAMRVNKFLDAEIDSQARRVLGRYADVDIPKGTLSKAAKEDHRAVVGASLDRLRKGLKSPVERRREWETLNKAAAQATLDAKGWVRTKRVPRAEALVKERGIPQAERFGRGGPHTGSMTLSVFDAQSQAIDEIAAVAKGGGSRADEALLEESLDTMGGYLKRRSTQLGGDLQAVRTYGMYRRAIDTLKEKMVKAYRKGNTKAGDKYHAILKKSMSDAISGVQTSGEAWMNFFMGHFAENVLGKAALVRAGLGNVFVGSWETTAYSITSLTNPLPLLYRGLKRGMRAGFKPFTNPKEFWKRAWDEATIGGSPTDRFGLSSVKASTPLQRALARATPKFSVQALRELDRVSTEAMSSLAESQALETTVKHYMSKGHTLDEVKELLARSIASVDEDTPAAFLVAHNRYTKMYTDRWLMRGSKGKDVSPVAQFGWMIHDGIETIKHSPSLLVKGTGTFLGLFSRTGANMIDYIARNTVLGVGTRGVNSRQILGTVAGMTAYYRLSADHYIMAQEGSGNIENFRRTSQAPGVRLGDTYIQFAEMGGFGDILHVMGRATQALDYILDDPGGLDSQRIVTGLVDLATTVYGNSWFNWKMQDWMHLVQATNGDEEDFAEFGKKHLRKFTPYEGLAGRIAAHFNGFQVPEEGMGGFTALKEALDDHESVPMRDAFGSVPTLDEVDKDMSRGLSDVASIPLFLYPNKNSRFRRVTSELNVYLADSGLLRGHQYFRYRDSKGHERQWEQGALPDSFNVRLNVPRRTLPIGGGQSVRLSYKELQVMRGIMSLDISFIESTLKGWSEDYDSMEYSGDAARLQAMTSATIKRQTAVAKAQIGRTLAQVYGRGGDEVRLRDVLHHLATSPLDKMSPAARMKVTRLRGTVERQLKGYRRGGKLRDAMGLSDKDVTAISEKVARNMAIADTYDKVTKYARFIMSLSPTVFEARRGLVATQIRER